MAELVGIAKAKHEAKVAREATKKRLPGFSTSGTRPNMALKDVILAQPICPKSQIRGKMVNGHYEPPEIGPDDMNCQLEGGQWWIGCEAKGHDPYWNVNNRIVTRTTFAIDEEGDKVPVEKRIVVEDKRLNVTSVSTSLRVGSGQAVRWKKRYFGFKPISDFGYEEVCHLSRCEKPIKIVSREYGAFCSQAHLQLVAAEENELILTRIDHQYALGEERRLGRRRARQLRNAVDNIETVDSDSETD